MTTNPSRRRPSTRPSRGLPTPRTCGQSQSPYLGQRYDSGGGGLNVARVVQELSNSTFAIYLAGGVTSPILEAWWAHPVSRANAAASGAL